MAGSGGPRARSGPAPDPDALRRDRSNDAGWTILPAEGRKGRTPAWPLDGKPTAREAKLWSEFWHKPQAVMWERAGQFSEVALYVRRFTEVEKRDAPTNLGTLVRQLGDDLGISLPGMYRHRWRIAVDEVAPKRAARTVTTASRFAAVSSAERA